MVAQSELESQVESAIPGHSLGGRKNLSLAIFEAKMKVSAQLGK